MITAKLPDLKNIMIRRGLTGAGLARISGISQAHVVYIIQGKRNILPPTAKKICDALNCAFDDVFEIQEKTR